MSREKAHVTPELLSWARKTQGLDITAAAKKIGRSEEELESWESGKELPSIAQARNMAKVYRRPLAVFFLPEVPKDFSVPLVDFRKLPEGTPADFSPQLRSLIRMAELRQEVAREILQGEGAKPLKWVGSAKGETDALKLGARIRKWLAIDANEIAALKNNAEALRLWIDRIEDRGAFVFQSGGPVTLSVDPGEARGFAISDKLAPFIMTNGKDADAGRLFTLVHELVHLWIGAPGISNLAIVKRARTDNQKTEYFCNAVAAEVLLPRALFDQQWARQVADAPSRIAFIARNAKISEDVVARTARETGKITWDDYFELRDVFAARVKVRSERKQEGGPDWALMVPKRAGYTFTRMVLSSFASGSMTGGDVSEYLNTKVKHLADIAGHAGLPWSMAGPAA